MHIYVISMFHNTHTVWEPTLTYPVKEFPTTGVLQEEVLYVPLLPNSVELDDVLVTDHAVNTHLQNIGTVLQSIIF